MNWTCLLIIIIFFIILGLLIGEKMPRAYLAVLGAVLMIVFGVFDIQEAIQFVNWETIGFLWGAFLLIEILIEAGFFNWAALLLARQLNYQPVKIFIFFPLFAFFLSAFLNSLTVMIFLSVVTFQLAKLLKFDPAPVIVTEVVLANIGGASTLVGDPPNVILGTGLGFGFNEFVLHNGPAAVVSALAALTVSYFLNRRTLPGRRQQPDEKTIQEIRSQATITDGYLLRLGLTGLAAMLIFLIGRPLLVQGGFPVSISMASLLPAFLILALGGPRVYKHHFMRKVDSETLIFFIGLFVIVGALEKRFIIQATASWLVNAFRTPFLFLSSLFWGVGTISGFVDNVPLAMTMTSLIKQGIGETHQLAAALLVWTVSLGVDLGGNLTPIGASANVVAYGYLQRNAVSINWKRWLQLAFVPSLTALFISYSAILLKMHLRFY